MTVDASADVSIYDKMGLQTDGTGVINDVLRLSYGSDFGTVTSVSWYKDGAIVITSGSGNNGIVEGDGGMELTVNPTRGTGTYKATVIADGKSYTTNEIIITDKEQAPTIEAFTLEDDYTDGTDLHYNTTDQRAVATVTLSKAYTGTLTIYKASDMKYANPINARDRLTTSNAVAATTAADAINDGSLPGDGNTVMTSNQATNYQVLNTVTADFGRGYGYINPDGTATYKWVLDDAGVVRGTDYVVTFDQASISSDTPGRGTANVSEKTTAPYVTAPEKIAVTKVANGSRPEVTFQDADGAELTWFGYETTDAQADLSGGGLTDQNGLGVSSTTQLEAVGIEAAQIYGATNKTNDPKASGVSALVSAVTNRVAANDDIAKGVWTTEIGANAGTAAYWFATATLTKGVFGADKIELKSEATDNAQDAATDMDLVESKTTATTATVKFSNLRTAGTVYIVQGNFQGTASTANNPNTTVIVKNELTVNELFNKFKANDPTTYTAKTTVEAGTASVDIPNAISANLTKVAGATGANVANGEIVNGKIVDEAGDAAATADTWTITGDTYGNDHYIAIFIPDDDVNYGMVYTDGPFSTDSYTSAPTGKSGLIITQVATTVDKSNMTAIMGACAGGITANTASGVDIAFDKIVVKDQFGTAMVYAADTINTAADVTTVIEKDSTNVEAYVVESSDAANDGSVTVSTRGVVSFNLQETSPARGAGKISAWDKGDGVTIKIPGLGTEITIVAKESNTGATAATLGVDTEGDGTFDGLTLAANASLAGTTDTTKLGNAFNIS